MKQLPLVQQSHIKVAIFLEFFTGQETQCPDTVVEVDKYEVIV